MIDLAREIGKRAIPFKIVRQQYSSLPDMRSCGPIPKRHVCVAPELSTKGIGWLGLGSFIHMADSFGCTEDFGSNCNTSHTRLPDHSNSGRWATLVRRLLSDFASEVAMRIWTARHGRRTGDRIRLIISVIIECFPVTIRRLIPTLDGILQRTTRPLLRKSVVVVEGLAYSPIDSESLIILHPKFEKELLEWLKPQRGQVFVDVGAHLGKYTLQAARIVGNRGLVVSLEPHPENFRALSNGIMMNSFKNVVALEVAAWHRDCQLQLFVGDAAGHHSTKMNRGIGHILVRARTIDDIVGELKLERVDWVKVDVEGAELEVLEGLRHTLAKYAPRVIMEVLDENAKAVLKLMEDCRYAVTPIARLGACMYLYCEVNPIRPDHSTQLLGSLLFPRGGDVDAKVEAGA